MASNTTPNVTIEHTEAANFSLLQFTSGNFLTHELPDDWMQLSDESQLKHIQNHPLTMYECSDVNELEKLIYEECDRLANFLAYHKCTLGEA
ncbi:MAG: hypothetical protein HAW67_04665 [Endozoicomonadaceae bacterium]|nr:hypothetical protein [Endozoicomonadaceae bacterium]